MYSSRYRVATSRTARPTRCCCARRRRRRTCGRSRASTSHLRGAVRTGAQPRGASPYPTGASSRRTAAIHPSRRAGQLAFLRPTSVHAAGVTGLADGSVRTVGYDVSKATWLSAITPDDASPSAATGERPASAKRERHGWSPCVLRFWAEHQRDHGCPGGVQFPRGTERNSSAVAKQAGPTHLVFGPSVSTNVWEKRRGAAQPRKTNEEPDDARFPPPPWRLRPSGHLPVVNRRCRCSDQPHPVHPRPVRTHYRLVKLAQRPRLRRRCRRPLVHLPVVRLGPLPRQAGGDGRCKHVAALRTLGCCPRPPPGTRARRLIHGPGEAVRWSPGLAGLGLESRL